MSACEIAVWFVYSLQTNSIHHCFLPEAVGPEEWPWFPQISFRVSHMNKAEAATSAPSIVPSTGAVRPPVADGRL
jgi:hypothetical protein